jgi:nitroreductase
MDVISAIKIRRSIRKFSERLVEDEKLQSILEAARLAPSAKNMQDWRFIVVRNNETRKKLAEVSQEWISSAPIIIVCCGTDPTGVMSCGQPRYTVDLSIATSFMILEATNQGLGTCWLGRFDEKAVKEILEIPEEVRVVTMFPLGYPAETPEPKPRKALDEIVSYDKY